MRYGVIGCGAVGGYYGGLLARSGCDVHFLARGDAAHIRDHGLVVESPGGNFVLPRVNVYADAAAMPRCDVAVVAIKTTANGCLPDLLPRVLGPRGIVLLLQNGLGEEDAIATLAGVREIVSGLCFLCSHKIGPGHVRHIDYGRIVLGQHKAGGEAAGVTPTMRALAEDLGGAGIEIAMEEDLATARWKKLVWNIPYNGLTVILNAMTDRIMADPAMRAGVEAVMCEVAAAGTACARPIGRGFVDRMLTTTDAMRPYWPSMKLDYDAGRPMEIESLYGTPVRRAEAAGYDMKQTRLLYRQLQFLAGQRAAGISAAKSA